MKYTIRKVDNGYIFQGSWGNEVIFPTLDDLLNHLLLMFEGRSETFNGDSFGKVVIARGETKKARHA